jgi:hypothetical protein
MYCHTPSRLRQKRVSHHRNVEVRNAPVFDGIGIIQTKFQTQTTCVSHVHNREEIPPEHRKDFRNLRPSLVLHLIPCSYRELTQFHISPRR